MGNLRKVAKKPRGRISKPAVLKDGHSLGSFDCGRPELTDWFKDDALKAMKNDTARTYVVCRGTKRVIAYYSLAAGAVDRAACPGRLARNTPIQIPVVLLARLAVNADEQGKGLGRALLADAFRRTVQAARVIGARAMLVHALDASAVSFYESLGFKPLKFDSRTLYLPLKTIRDGL